jgi:UDP:flavonoid glycosyltransferase YjiC (YdhE family)
VLVGHTLSFATRVFEEVHRVPAATLHLAPSVMRSDFQQPVFEPGSDISGWPTWLKRAIWWWIDRRVLDPAVAPELNRWRRELGLAPVSRVLKAWAQSDRCIIGLFPEWFGPRQPDWPPQLRLTGFPLYDGADAQPVSSGLQTFLEAGSAPVVFTFGTANRAATPYFAAGLDAARRLGRRTLFLTKYPEQLPPLGPDAWHESYAPFSLILPRCGAMVHHGGIGTCAQGLAAGVPQLTMPIAFDQPDNTARLSRLGVGQWIRPEEFTADRVAAALRPLMEDAAVGERCAYWANQVRTRDAVGETCAILEALLPD